MQPTGGVINLTAEFAAGVKRRHDHFERRFVPELRMRVHRNAAAVVAHGEHVVGLQLDLDARGAAGDGLVHGVVENLGGEMVQRVLVGAADVHARPPPHRLEPFQHLDIARGVAVRAHGRRVKQIGRFGHLSAVRDSSTPR